MISYSYGVEILGLGKRLCHSFYFVAVPSSAFKSTYYPLNQCKQKEWWNFYRGPQINRGHILLKAVLGGEKQAQLRNRATSPTHSLKSWRVSAPGGGAGILVFLNMLRWKKDRREWIFLKIIGWFSCSGLFSLHPTLPSKALALWPSEAWRTRRGPQTLARRAPWDSSVCPWSLEGTTLSRGRKWEAVLRERGCRYHRSLQNLW